MQKVSIVFTVQMQKQQQTNSFVETNVGNILRAYFSLFFSFWSFLGFHLVFVYILKYLMHCWFSVAAVGAGQKVYGCALPPGYGSEDSQVLLYSYCCCKTTL